MAKTSKQNSAKTNVWDFLTNVLIAAMNKGQFPLAILAGVFVFMIWRMPAEDVSRLVFRILDALESGHLLGYVLFVLVTGAWFIHARWQRRLAAIELERVTGERNTYQEKAISAPVESSVPQQPTRTRKERK